MYDHFRHQLWLANARITARIQEATNDRLVDPYRPTVRRSLGHSIIKIGERVAEEPPLTVARSR